jgi:hypothetical protein
MLRRLAEVAKLADALRSGRSELYAHVGSSPTFGIHDTAQVSFLGFFYGPDGTLNLLDHHSVIGIMSAQMSVEGIPL